MWGSNGVLVHCRAVDPFPSDGPRPRVGVGRSLHCALIPKPCSLPTHDDRVQAALNRAQLPRLLARVAGGDAAQRYVAVPHRLHHLHSVLTGRPARSFRYSHVGRCQAVAGYRRLRRR